MIVRAGKDGFISPVVWAVVNKGGQAEADHLHTKLKASGASAVASFPGRSY
jgi:hypothetical protein